MDKVEVKIMVLKTRCDEFANYFEPLLRLLGYLIRNVIQTPFAAPNAVLRSLGEAPPA